MKIARLLLLIVGIACAVVTVSFSQSWNMDGTSSVTELRIGYEPSPWFRREVRDGVSEYEVNFLSGSVLFALGAVASFWAYARLGRLSENSNRGEIAPS